MHPTSSNRLDYTDYTHTFTFVNIFIVQGVMIDYWLTVNVIVKVKDVNCVCETVLHFNLESIVVG